MASRTDLFEEKIKAEAAFLTGLITKWYPGKNGLLPQLVDAERGLVINRRAIIDELGDYLPYLAASGKDGVAWALGHIRDACRLSQSSLGLFDVRISVDAQIPRRNRLVYSIHNADTINGLVTTYLLLRDDATLKVIERFFAGATRYFVRRGLVRYAVSAKLHFSLPIANALTAAYFAEELVNLYHATRRSDYLNLAKELLEPHLQSDYFFRHGFFAIRTYSQPMAKPFFETAFLLLRKPSSHSSVIVKDNCYIIFALLALFRATRDPGIGTAIERWIQSFLEKAYAETGSFFNVWRPGAGRSVPAGLQQSHSLIELFQETALCLGERWYLRAAEDMARFWLGRQDQRTGLIEEREGSGEALLDPHVDFVIELLRLSETTGNGEYREQAQKILEAVIRYFRVPYGYAWKVGLSDGRVLEARIETKFLGLLLKGFLVMGAVREGRLITKDASLHLLARDR